MVFLEMSTKFKCKGEIHWSGIASLSRPYILFRQDSGKLEFRDARDFIGISGQTSSVEGGSLARLWLTAWLPKAFTGEGLTRIGCSLRQAVD